MNRDDIRLNPPIREVPPRNGESAGGASSVSPLGNVSGSTGQPASAATEAAIEAAIQPENQAASQPANRPGTAGAAGTVAASGKDSAARPAYSGPVVRISDLTRDFDQAGSVVRVLKGVSFEVNSGEFVAIQGTSGSGKSTLLQILGMLDRPSSGVYELLGRDVANLDDDQLSGLRADTTGFVFQNFYLIPYATALENVLLPGLYSSKPQKHARERAAFLLDSVGLGDRKDFLPARLSGGQQQRVALARALFNEPALILADEPTGQLDSNTSKDILDLLNKFNDEGQTIILVTHDSATAARAKRRILIQDGLIESDELLVKG